jgi:hypothetical protein
VLTATPLPTNYSFINLPTINSLKFLVVSVGHIFVPITPTNLPSVPNLVFLSVIACLIMVISVLILLPIGFTLLDMLSSMNKFFPSKNLHHIQNHLPLLYPASYHFLPFLFLKIPITRVSSLMLHVLPPLQHVLCPFFFPIPLPLSHTPQSAATFPSRATQPTVTTSPTPNTATSSPRTPQHTALPLTSYNATTSSPRAPHHTLSHVVPPTSNSHSTCEPPHTLVTLPPLLNLPHFSPLSAHTI